MEQLQLLEIEPGRAVRFELGEDLRAELITLMAEAITTVYRGIEVEDESVDEPEDSPRTCE